MRRERISVDRFELNRIAQEQREREFFDPWLLGAKRVSLDYPPLRAEGFGPPRSSSIEWFRSAPGTCRRKRPHIEPDNDQPMGGDDR